MSANNRIDEILEYARFYASGDNKQPFRFIVNDNKLIVVFDGNEIKESFVFHERPIILSLGSFLESYRIAASDFGYDIDIRYLVERIDLNDRNELLEITLHKKLSIENSTCCRDDLKFRHTDRSPSVEFVNNELFEELKVESGFTNDEIVRSEEEGFAKFVARGDAAVTLWASAIRDIGTHVSFRGVPKVGFPVSNVASNFPEFLFLLSIKLMPFVSGLLKYIGFFQVNSLTNLLLHKNSHRLIFKIKKGASFKERVELACKIQRFWVFACKNKCIFHPCTLSSMLLNDFVLGSDIEKSLGTKFHKLRSEGLKAIENLVDLNSEDVFWVVRLGKQERNFPDKKRTDRLNVPQIIIN